MHGMLTKTVHGLKGCFENRLKILAYHGVPDDNPSLYDVNIDAFRRQMEIIHDERYNVLDLDDGMAKLHIGTLPERSLVITFDDAYKSIFCNAAPVLTDFGYPATIFVPTGLVGKTKAQVDGSDSPEKLMTWEELQRLSATGFSVGSHTVHHVNMLILDNASRAREIMESHRNLVKHFGNGRYYFAYPYGLVDIEIRNLVAQSPYAGAVCFGSVLSNWAGTDSFMLKREKILSTTNPNEFRKLIDPSKDFGRALRVISAKTHMNVKRYFSSKWDKRSFCRPTGQ